MKDITIRLLKCEVRPRARNEHQGKARCYFHHKNETIMDNLLNRRSRPQELYRLAFPEVLKEIVKVTGKGEISWLWSQKAGCSCGCSPGFILTGLDGYDIFVDITIEEKQTELVLVAVVLPQVIKVPGTDFLIVV